MPVRVVVCANRAITREGLKTMLGAAPDVTVVRTAPDASSSLAAWRATRSDVVIADLPCANDEIGAAIRLLVAGGRLGPRVIAVCHDEGPDIASELLAAGACGLVTHDADASEMVLAVRAAVRGQLYLAPCLAGDLIDWLRSRTAGIEDSLLPRAEGLTSREREVLVALARGNSLEETAQQLFISTATVRTHVYRLRHKVRARDRAELVSFAFRAGMVGASVSRDVAAGTA
ncbi:MAG: response regulator transcription factor [Jatrophihabitantaceae bacterium]